jgi:hypothetical protein
LIPTVAEALLSLTVHQLKQLATLVSTAPKQTNKESLVAAIASHLEGDNLIKLWNQLDELQQAAIAEVVHGDTNLFPAERFEAKYGKHPNWKASPISAGLLHCEERNLL